MSEGAQIATGSNGNLRSWQPGQSGNPSGRQRVKEFREALRRVFIAKKRMAHGEEVPDIDYLLMQLKEAIIKNLESKRPNIAVVMPFLLLYKETFDGKAPEVEVEDKHERSVVLLEGGVQKTEETHTQTVRLETGDGGTDN